MKNQLPIWRLSEPLFSKPGEKYYLKYKKQIEKRGFSDEEVWDLYGTICKFILPRIKLLRKWGGSTPMDMFSEEYLQSLGESKKWNKKQDAKFSKEAAAKWDEVLDKMIKAFELCIDNSYKEEEFAQINEGLALFAKHFRSLWD